MRRFGLILLTLGAVAADAQNVCSRFIAGLDGWTASNAVCGNTGGEIDCVDRGGPSNFVAPTSFHGNWTANGCSQLCFDARLVRPPSAPLSFTITNGTDSATFTTATTTPAAGRQTYCAPVAQTQNNAPPQGDDGTWTLAPGSDWNALISNVTSLALAIDLLPIAVENIRFDNVCLRSVPCAIAEFTSTSACEGQPTVFTDQSTQATEWLWTFGDTGVPPSTEQHPSVVLPPGRHDITLCINSSTAPVCVTHRVVVHDSPPAPALTAASACGPPVTYCLPQTFGLSYAWSGTNVQLSETSGRCTSVAVTGAPATLTATTALGRCSASTTVALNGCPRSKCCADPPFHIVNRDIIASPYTQDLAVAMTLDIAAPYRAVEMTLVSAENKYDGGCNVDRATQAFFKNPHPVFGAPAQPTPPFPRELTWLYGGPETHVTLAAAIGAVPSATAGGCNDEVRLCFKFTVILADGKPCERIACYTLRRDVETGYTLFP